MYFCVDCERYFEERKFYYETHGLDTPPYERVRICPNCGSDNYYYFETTVEKTEIIENLLCAIMKINRLSDGICNLFGCDAANEDLAETFGILQEMVEDMFDFMDVSVQKKLLNLKDENTLQEILDYLKGGL